MTLPHFGSFALVAKWGAVFQLVLLIACFDARASSVVAWGYNGSAQTNVPAGLSTGVTVVSGGSHCLALKTDGKTTGWGYNAYSQAAAPATLSNVVAVAGGGEHSLGLRKDGSVFGWG